MQKNDLSPGFVDKLTLFAMQQISRRGFIKISGRAVALLGTVEAWVGLSGFGVRPSGGPTLLCPPGCIGPCWCQLASYCRCGNTTCICPLGACDRGVYYKAYCAFNLDNCAAICGCKRC